MSSLIISVEEARARAREVLAFKSRSYYVDATELAAFVLHHFPETPVPDAKTQRSEISTAKESPKEDPDPST